MSAMRSMMPCARYYTLPLTVDAAAPCARAEANTCRAIFNIYAPRDYAFLPAPKHRHTTTFVFNIGYMPMQNIYAMPPATRIPTRATTLRATPKT